VLQFRALQLSDRSAPATARATKPLAKPVQIAAGVHVVKSTRAAVITSAHGARAAA